MVADSMPVTLLARCPRPDLSFERGEHSKIYAGLCSFVEKTYVLGIDCCFGLELKAAYRLEAAYVARHIEDRAPFRQILLRPAVEPILLSFAETFVREIADADAINRLSPASTVSRSRDGQEPAASPPTGSAIRSSSPSRTKHLNIPNAWQASSRSSWAQSTRPRMCLRKLS